MSQKKILKLSCGYKSSNGVATVTKELAESLVQINGFEVDVLTYWPFGEKKHTPFSFIQVGKNRQERDFRTLDEAVASLLLDHDVVHFHNGIFGNNYLNKNSNMSLDDLLRSVRPELIIYTAHTLSATRYHAGLRPWKDLDESNEREIMERSNLIIHLSEEQRSLANSRHPHLRDKTRVIGNGTNLKLGISKREKQVVRRELSDEGQKLGLYLGRISPEKGIYELAAALQLIKRQHPDFKLLIAGNKQSAHGVLDSTSDKTNTLMMDCGMVRGQDYDFLGWIREPEKSRIISASDMMLMPSYYEHFSMAALECMVLDTPVVMSNISGHRTIFSLDNSQSRLALAIPRVQGRPIIEPRNIATAVNYALNNPREMERMSNRAKSEVERNYTWSNISRQLGELIELNCTVPKSKPRVRTKKTGSKVATVIASYNSRRTVGSTINSLLNQTYRGAQEIIIVDDESTDQTLEYLHDEFNGEIKTVENRITGLSRDYNPKGRITIIRQKNKHYAGARNTGYQEAHNLGCNFVTHQDADDIALPKKLAVLVYYLNRHPEKGWVHSKAHTMDEFGFLGSELGWDRYYGAPYLNRPSLWTLAERKHFDDKPQEIEKKNYIHNQTLMFRMDSLVQLGIDQVCDESLARHSDYDLSKRLIRRGIREGFVNQYTAVARWHDKGITGSNRSKKSGQELLHDAAKSSDPLVKASLYLAARRRDVNTMDSHYQQTISQLSEGAKHLHQGNSTEKELAFKYAHRLAELEPNQDNLNLLRRTHAVVLNSLLFRRNYARNMNKQSQEWLAKRAYTFSPRIESDEALSNFRLIKVK